ncbi:MAG: D-alanyl-D-alanine carboxypeptidase, partial [Verrucomicrobiota bacterium]
MRFLSALLISLIGASSSLAQEAPAQPQLVAASALSINAADGVILYQKNIHEKRAVASTQKLMSALVVAEKGELSESVLVKQTDQQIEPRNLWITSGSRYKKDKLLEMMVVKSFNDVTKCLARHTAGSQGAFAKLMN